MEKLKGLVYVALAAIIFGCIPFFVKNAIYNGFNEYTFILFRCIFASIILYILIKKKGLDIFLTKKQKKDVFKISLLGYGLMLLTLLLSYNYIPTGIATSIHFVYPLVVMVGGIVFYKEKLSIEKIGILTVAVIGIYLIIGVNNDIEFNIIGFLLAFVSGVAYAYYMLEVGNGPLKNVNSFQLVFYISALNIFFFSVAAILVGKMSFGFNRTGAVYVVLLSVLSVVGMVSFKKGLELINTVTAGILSTFEPLTSLLVGVFFLGESLSLYQFAGSILILASVVYASILERKSIKTSKKRMEIEIK